MPYQKIISSLVRHIVLQNSDVTSKFSRDSYFYSTVHVDVRPRVKNNIFVKTALLAP